MEILANEIIIFIQNLQNFYYPSNKGETQMNRNILKVTRGQESKENEKLVIRGNWKLNW